MQSDHPFLYQDPLFPGLNPMGGTYIHNAPNASGIGGITLPTDVGQPKPFHGVNFQSSEACPKNFIIFDQTVDRRQIMFHPGFAPKFCLPSLNVHSAYVNRDNLDREAEAVVEKELSSSYEEDPDDIDALLSWDEEEEECEDDDEVSTARTQGGYGSDSSDSCSSYGSKAKKARLPSSSMKKTSACGKSERKRQKMRKMVQAIRGIVPGGSSQMNTAAVLDEAVRYLKSLKVEMQKIGVTNLK